MCRLVDSWLVILDVFRCLFPQLSIFYRLHLLRAVFYASSSSYPGDGHFWWWCRPHPVREHAQDLRPPLGARPASSPALGPPSFFPHTSSSAATPTGSVHKSQTVSVVGMSGQLKRCNESWFGSLQSGQFDAGWLAGSILCR